MGHLLSFDPSRKLGYPSTDNPDREATERDLFEAFWIGFRSMDTPKFGAEVESSINLKRELRERSVDGGSIKLAHCPGCGLRQAQFLASRTIEQKLDIIIENEDFDYINACFNRWERVWDDLQPYFATLKKRFDEMKPKRAEDWKKFLEERDKPAADAAG